ncbi:hypothetical protein BOX15_Mlig009420g1 [Macrostomum lignano]|nr:hypothetical protein BOX15_Mlig009420g1 [Macrostomum lignano]
MTEPPQPQLHQRPATVAACARLGRVVSDPARRRRYRAGGASSAKWRPLAVPPQPQKEPERGFALFSSLTARRRQEAADLTPSTPPTPLDAGQLFAAEPTAASASSNDALVGHLRERVDALASLLEEERQRRCAEVAELTAEAGRSLARQAQMQEAEVAELAAQQRAELARIAEENAKMLQAEADRRRESLSQLESRIEYLDGGFHSFVQASGRRFEARWSARAAELTAENEAAARQMAELAAARAAQETEDQLSAARAANAAATEQLRRRQAEALEELRQLHAPDEAAMLQLAATDAEVKSKQSQLQSLRQQLNSRARDLREARRQLADAQTELRAAAAADASNNVERLAEVEAAWQERLTRQRTELEDLRRACEEVGAPIASRTTSRRPAATRQRRASFPASSV